jgi:DnaK suppressor protein
MRDQELKKFKTMLEAKRNELSELLQQRDEIAIQRSAEPLEESQLAAQRDMAVWSRHLESRLLREVRAALDRISDGTYGFCLHCEGEISPKRLAAVPWASYCIRCQEELDSQQAQQTAGPDWRYLAALAQAA